MNFTIILIFKLWMMTSKEINLSINKKRKQEGLEKISKEGILPAPVENLI